jgi:hypothetical protein
MVVQLVSERKKTVSHQIPSSKLLILLKNPVATAAFIQPKRNNMTSVNARSQ